MDNLGFIVAGYGLTALVLGGYTAHLLYRSRRARERAATILAKRRP